MCVGVCIGVEISSLSDKYKSNGIDDTNRGLAGHEYIINEKILNKFDIIYKIIMNGEVYMLIERGILKETILCLNFQNKLILDLINESGRNEGKCTMLLLLQLYL